MITTTSVTRPMRTAAHLLRRSSHERPDGRSVQLVPTTDAA